MFALQGSLLVGGSDSAVGDLRAAERHCLGSGAWIDLLPGWVQGADSLFAHLLEVVPWRASQRPMYDRVVDVPRLTCTYDLDGALPHPRLDDLRHALDDHYGASGAPRLASLGLALYRDGRDSVAWHGDTIGRRRLDDTLVAIVALGHPRRLLLRPRGGRTAHRLELGHGDLLVMGGTCQRTWEHAVPKTARPVGPRISAQFRSPGVS